MSEEDSKACQQCAELHDSLEPCEGGCGREICSYCGPKCKDCTDQELYDRLREEEKEEKRRKREAKKPKWEPERSLGEKVWNGLGWAFGFADGALRDELQRWPGEFDDYEFEDVQEMMRARWKGLPEWKKKLYRGKKQIEMSAMQTALKVGMTGSRWIGHIDQISRAMRKDYDAMFDDQYSVHEEEVFEEESDEELDKEFHPNDEEDKFDKDDWDQEDEKEWNEEEEED